MHTKQKKNLYTSQERYEQVSEQKMKLLKLNSKPLYINKIQKGTTDTFTRYNNISHIVGIKYIQISMYNGPPSKNGHTDTVLAWLVRTQLGI